jgi:hypothetical protein
LSIIGGLPRNDRPQALHVELAAVYPGQETLFPGEGALPLGLAALRPAQAPLCLGRAAMPLHRAAARFVKQRKPNDRIQKANDRIPEADDLIQEANDRMRKADDGIQEGDGRIQKADDRMQEADDRMPEANKRRTEPDDARTEPSNRRGEANNAQRFTHGAPGRPRQPQIIRARKRHCRAERTVFNLLVHSLGQSIPVGKRGNHRLTFSSPHNGRHVSTTRSAQAMPLSS